MSYNSVVEELRLNRQFLSLKCKKVINEEACEIHTCSMADGEYCSCYAYPDAKWRSGDCPKADDVLREQVEIKQQVKQYLTQKKHKKKSIR